MLMFLTDLAVKY